MFYLNNYLKITEKAGANRHLKQVIFDHLVICNPPFGGFQRCMGDRIIAVKKEIAVESFTWPAYCLQRRDSFFHSYSSLLSTKLHPQRKCLISSVMITSIATLNKLEIRASGYTIYNNLMRAEEVYINCDRNGLYNR